MNHTYIYGLVDPISGDLRYIGKANDPMKRLKAHLYHCKGERTHKANWIRKLLCSGCQPEVIILEFVPTDYWKEREQYWIRRLKAEGGSLVNATDGGEGMIGYNHSLEGRRKISLALKGRIIHQSWRSKLSKAGLRYSPARVRAAKKMLNMGCQQAVVANRLGISKSTVGRMAHGQAYGWVD